MENTRQYYKELGRAAYAIAIADGQISPEEHEALHHFVLKQLVSEEKKEDSSHMNEAFYVDFAFDEAAAQQPDPAGAVRSFLRYLHTHYQPSDEQLVKRSVSVLKQVASAYSRKREKEVLSLIENEIREVYR